MPLLDAAERARGASPKSLQIRAQLASARGDEAAARDALTHAVELDPIDPELRLALADAAQALGDGAGAASSGSTRRSCCRDSDALADRSAQNRAGGSVDLTGVDDRIAALVQSFARSSPRPVGSSSPACASASRPANNCSIGSARTYPTSRRSPAR